MGPLSPAVGPQALPLTFPGLAGEAREGAAEPGTGLGGKAACSAGGQSRALAPGRQPSHTVEKIPGTKASSRHHWPPLLVPGAPQLTNLTSGPGQVWSLHGLRRRRRGSLPSLHGHLPSCPGWWASQREALISPSPPPRHLPGFQGGLRGSAGHLNFFSRPLAHGVQSRWFHSSRTPAPPAGRSIL